LPLKAFETLTVIKGYTFKMELRKHCGSRLQVSECMRLCEPMCVCCCLTQVLQRVEVTEKLQIKSCIEKLQTFNVTFHFLPPERYQEDKILTPQQILRFMETRCSFRLFHFLIHVMGFCMWWHFCKTTAIHGLRFSICRFEFTYISQ